MPDMCGRFTIITPVEKLIEEFEAQMFEDTFFPNYNAYPGQKLPVITNELPSKINLYVWGLIPYWAKDSAIGFKLINARAETLMEKDSFKNAVKRRRCLVLADSYYEWKKAGKLKIPYRILLKNEKPFALAGIWETWRDRDNKEIRTFSIITTKANPLTEGIHDRMPCLLDKRSRALWLNNTVPEAQALNLLKPYPSEEMKYYEISTLVNSPDNNTPAVIEPVESYKLL